MAIISILGDGVLLRRDGAYWVVALDGGEMQVYQDNLRLGDPAEGTAVVVTREHGRHGLVVTACRAPGDSELG